MKRTLITGTNGFLANRVIDFCDGQVFGISRSDNHKSEKKCTTFYGSIQDIEFLKRIISENEIDVIYHLAAQSVVKIANVNPKYTFENNVIGTVNVLEAVRQINPNIKVLCASSDKSYGEQNVLPYTEDMCMKASDIYSTSKSCCDLAAQSYYLSYGLNVNIVRSANIYGAGDMNLSRIIPNTIIRILNKEKPIIYSGVMQYKREFVYVDDVCEAYNTIAEKGVSGESYNVGTGEIFRVGDIVEEICNLMNWGGGIDIIDKSFKEITTQYLSSDKICKLGWNPKTMIKEGILKAIKFYTEKSK